MPPGFAVDGSKTASSFNGFRGINGFPLFQVPPFIPRSIDPVPSPAALGAGQQDWLFHRRLPSIHFLGAAPP